mgnify:FL=1
MKHVGRIAATAAIALGAFVGTANAQQSTLDAVKAKKV